VPTGTASTVTASTGTASRPTRLLPKKANNNAMEFPDLVNHFEIPHAAWRVQLSKIISRERNYRSTSNFQDICTFVEARNL
jgi:hypothetical protein